MGKTISINENWDFKRIYKKGKSMVHPVLVTYAIKNKKPYNRIGLTATKKVGKACQRNRARRVIKAAYQQLEPTLPVGYDFVFVARSRTTTVKMGEVLVAMKGQMRQLMGEKK